MLKIVNKDENYSWNIILSSDYNLINFHNEEINKKLISALRNYFSKSKNNIIVFDENDQLINPNEYRFIQLEIIFNEELTVNKNKELELYCINQIQANDIKINEIEKINNQIDDVNFNRKINNILKNINFGINIENHQKMVINQYTIDTLIQNINFSNNTKLNTGLINCNVSILNTLNTDQRVILYISKQYVSSEVITWIKMWSSHPHIFILIEDGIHFDFKNNLDGLISYSYLKNENVNFIQLGDYLNTNFTYYALTILPYNDIYLYQNSKIKDILAEFNSYNSSLYLKNETFNVNKTQ